jgi:hypothetical protein
MSNWIPDETRGEAFESISVWGECGEFTVPGSLWLTLLNVAKLYGWNPVGTDSPDPESFDVYEHVHDGAYYPPIAQKVAKEDAERLAKALERAFSDIPDVASEEESDPFVGWYEESSLMDRLGAIKRPILQWFIAHCRECGELWLC